MDLQVPQKQPIAIMQEQTTDEFLKESQLFLQQSKLKLEEAKKNTGMQIISLLQSMQQSVSELHATQTEQMQKLQKLEERVNVLEAWKTVKNKQKTNHAQEIQNLTTQINLKILAGTSITALLLLCWWYFNQIFDSAIASK